MYIVSQATPLARVWLARLGTWLCLANIALDDIGREGAWV